MLCPWVSLKIRYSNCAPSHTSLCCLSGYFFSPFVLAWKTENQKYEDYTWMREHRLGTFQRVQVACREVWFVLCLWASSRWDLEMRSLQIC